MYGASPLLIQKRKELPPVFPGAIILESQQTNKYKYIYIIYIHYIYIYVIQNNCHL